MSDERARHLVEYTYQRLNTNVQEKLKSRNQRRFQTGDLTYQYLEPIWLSNSIHN